ncbi:MAG: type I methionyl aminopeptidase [Anaerorhabdus sp.]
MSEVNYQDYYRENINKIKELEAKGHTVPSISLIKSPDEIKKIKASAKINRGALDLVASKIKAGMTTLEIDEMVKEYTHSFNAICAPYNYQGYPKNLCTSINEEVCHGIPSRRVKLKDGDIINVDVSTILDGYFSDSSRMFCIGNVSENKRKLVEVTKECLKEGIKAVKPWGFVGDIGFAISELAKKHNYSVVRELGGHGIGLEFHEDPFISHVGQKNHGMLLLPGMIFTIEPMINEGVATVLLDRYNQWTVTTADKKMSAQVEHMLLVTMDGVEILCD